MNDNDKKSWWHYPHMWMVVGGPLVVVVASIVTGYIAMTGQDPVLATDYYRQGLEINMSLENLQRQGSLAPALSARNHAATPATAPAEKTRN